MGNSREGIEERKIGNKGDINVIRKKIRKSLEEKDKESFPELNNLGKDNNPKIVILKEPRQLSTSVLKGDLQKRSNWPKRLQKSFMMTTAWKHSVL